MPATVDDVELVCAARAGDAGAMGALLERHRAALYASALSMLGERGLAQDAVQDTFLVALRRIDDLRDPDAFAGWLHAIVRNACRMRLRRPFEDLPGELPDDARAPSDAEQALERLALSDWVWTALGQLPQDLRVVVMLRYFTRHATAYAEIAATLGIPVGTVRSRLNHAKARLADALLDAASSTHVDHDKLVERRRLEWDAIVHEIHATGNAALYVAGCASDMLVDAPSIGYRERGPDDHRRGVEDSVAAGVRLHLTGVVAGPGVTIVEGTYENPPHDPHHCPTTHTEVRLHPTGQTTRLLLYYPTTVRQAARHLAPLPLRAQRERVSRRP